MLLYLFFSPLWKEISEQSVAMHVEGSGAFEIRYRGLELIFGSWGENGRDRRSHLSRLRSGKGLCKGVVGFDRLTQFWVPLPVVVTSLASPSSLWDIGYSLRK